MTGESSGENALIHWYRQHIGEPERTIDVYLGFSLFFGGIILGVLGFILFTGEQLITGPGKLYWLREIAFSLGALGLPVLLLAVVVLLPVDRRALYAALVGLTISVIAIGFFVSTYPYQWDVSSGPDYSMNGVAIYASGLIVVLISTSSALVNYHIERTAPASGEQHTPSREQETVSDEQIRQDIDEALTNTTLSWGGLRKKDTQKLHVDFTDEGEIKHSNFGTVKAKTVRLDSVDDAVAGLRELQGGEKRTERGSSTDDQAAALRRLREQQKTTDRPPESRFHRVKSWIREKFPI